MKKPTKASNFSQAALAANLLAALMLAGCVSSGEHAYPGDHGSIKDAPHAATGRPAYVRIKAVKATPRTEPDTQMPDEVRSRPLASPSKLDRGKLAVARQATVQSPATEAERSERRTSGPAEEVRPSLSSRRNAPDGVEALKSPAQPKSNGSGPAAPTDSTARNPVVSEVSQVIEQAELMLRIGNVKGAREVLAPAVSARNPEALAELGKTYDPIELAKFLTTPGAADSAKAIQYYTEAARLGSLVAKVRLERLAAPPDPPEKRR